MDTKFCPRCERDVSISLFMPNKARTDGLSSYCRACHNELNEAGRRKRRLVLIAQMGGCCVRCGFSDERALQVDHIHGGGSQAIKNGLNTGTARYYREVLANPDKYQLLCANCNWIKRAENNEAVGRYSPHKVSVVRAGTHSPAANARRSESLKLYHAGS